MSECSDDQGYAFWEAKQNQLMYQNIPKWSYIWEALQLPRALEKPGNSRY